MRSVIMGMNVEIEEKYLKELAGGSRKAFEVLYMTYAPRVEYFLRGLLKNDLEAEDITQDIFYKIWSNRETITQIDSFKSYLFRMAKNAVYNHYSHLLVKDYHFADNSLKEIAAELERIFNVRIKIEDDDIEKYRYHISFVNHEVLPDMLDAINNDKKLIITYNKDTIEIRKRR